MKEVLTSLLVFGAATFSVISGTNRTMCFRCHNVTDMAYCHGIAQCEAGQGCFTKEIVLQSGSSQFEAGCLSHKDCIILQSTAVGVGRRDVIGCYKCCTTDLCNGYLCDVATITVAPSAPPTTAPSTTTLPTTTKKLTTCYTCTEATNLTDCQVIKTCAAEQDCFATRAVLFGTTRYSLGCENTTACTPSLGGTFTNLGPFCTDCCHGNNCNIGLCGLRPLPTFTLKPVNRTMEVGDIAKLRCETEPSSNAKITWTFESTTGSTALPEHVGFGLSNTSVFFEITANHFGNWTCIATNTFGASSASAYISHLTSRNK